MAAYELTITPDLLVLLQFPDAADFFGVLVQAKGKAGFLVRARQPHAALVDLRVVDIIKQHVAIDGIDAPARPDPFNVERHTQAFGDGAPDLDLESRRFRHVARIGRCAAIGAHGIGAQRFHFCKCAGAGVLGNRKQ